MIIVPDRFMDLNTCTLKVSGEILDYLLKEIEINYIDLFKRFQSKYNDSADYIFKPALSFLYLLGKLEYNLEKDTVRLIV